MKLGHVAIYVKDIEKSGAFYKNYFGGITEYESSHGRQKTLFLSFGKDTTALEIMQRTGIPDNPILPGGEQMGCTHLAFDIGSTKELLELTERLRQDGYTIAVEPTDYGTKDFFESCVLDPDGIRVEIGVPKEILHRERGEE